MLKQRVLSAVLGIPLLIVIFKIGGLAFLAFNLLVVTLGMNEYFKLVQGKGIEGNKILGIIIGLTLVLLTYLNSKGMALVYGFLSLALVIILLKQVIVKLDQSAILTTATTFFGVFYIAGLFSHLILLYNLQVEGKQLGQIIIWLPILATWLTDTGAYFTGMNFGKRPLAPKISPNKTVEGAIGGLISSVIITVIVSIYLDFGYLHGIILGIIIAIVAQLGDLCESVFKRDAEIKDSGDVIPGHGGVLDRIDSLLFSLPVVYYYLQWIVLK